MSYTSLRNAASGHSSPDMSPQTTRPMTRNLSFGSMLWMGEQGPTSIIDNNLNAHLMCENGDKETAASNYGSTEADFIKTIRFQVVIWSVGPPDCILGRVNMKFRVTIFWNDIRLLHPTHPQPVGQKTDTSPTVWVMAGRQKAYERRISRDAVETIDIPQVSILNVQHFEVIGSPEVTLLRKDSRLMRWTCLYRATMLQGELHCLNCFRLSIDALRLTDAPPIYHLLPPLHLVRQYDGRKFSA